MRLSFDDYLEAYLVLGRYLYEHYACRYVLLLGNAVRNVVVRGRPLEVAYVWNLNRLLLEKREGLFLIL